MIAGTPETNRTSDLPLRRGLLYPLSYRGPVMILAQVRQNQSQKAEVRTVLILE